MRCRLVSFQSNEVSGAQNSEFLLLFSRLFSCTPSSVTQGLTILHLSAQPRPYLSLKPHNVSYNRCSRQADNWMSVSPCRDVPDAQVVPGCGDEVLLVGTNG